LECAARFEPDAPDEPVVPEDPVVLDDPAAPEDPVGFADAAVEDPDTAGATDGLELELPWLADGAEWLAPPGTVGDGAFTLGSETCGGLGTEGVGSGGTVTEGVVMPPAGVGTVTEGTVGTPAAPLEPGSAAKPEVNSPTTSTGSTAIFRDIAS
jgi:hypothetical protein